MRTIHITGGFSGTAVLDLSDTRAELVGATFKACLQPEGTATPPAVGHASWLIPTVDTQSDADAVIAHLVDNTTAAGHYNLALDVFVGGRHELVWARDADNPERRALVHVT